MPTIMFFLVTTVTLAMACNVGGSSAFLSYSPVAQTAFGVSRTRQHHYGPFVSLHRANDIPSNNIKDNTSTLTFSGDIVKTSRILATTRNDKNHLVQFFQSRQARDLLFVTDSPPDPVDPIPEALLEAWKREARHVGTTPPTGSSEDEVVMALSSDTIRFPGLQVLSCAYSGCKSLSQSQTGTGLPVYEFTMIGEETKARGTRLQVWIFNQLLGLQQQDTTTNSRDRDKKTTSAGRVALMETADGMLVQFTSSFQIRIQVPSLALRILPISKEHVQDQATVKIRNFVERGIDASVARLEHTFENTLQTNNILKAKPHLSR